MKARKGKEGRWRAPLKYISCGRKIQQATNARVVYKSYEGGIIITGFRHINCPVQGEEVKKNE